MAAPIVGIAGVCKFCGCTENTACRIPIKILAGDPVLCARGEAEGFVPCSWLLSDVCTHPACVEKAYAEAGLILSIDQARAFGELSLPLDDECDLMLIDHGAGTGAA